MRLIGKLLLFRIAAARLASAVAAPLLAWALGALFLALPPQTADLLKPSTTQGVPDLDQLMGMVTTRLVAFYLAIFVWAGSIWFWTRWCLDLEPTDLSKAGDEEKALRRWLPPLLMFSALATALVPVHRSTHGSTSAEFWPWMLLNLTFLAVTGLILRLLVWPLSEGDPIVPDQVNAIGKGNVRSCLERLPGGRWSFLPWLVGFVALGWYLAEYPVWLPFLLGAPAIAFVGATLAAGTLIFVVVIARRAFGVPGLLALAAWMFVGGQVTSNHVIRTIASMPVDDGSEGGPSPTHREVDERPDLRAAIEAWVKQCAPDADNPRMVVVATAGGASRAALWTARVLHDVEELVGRDFRRSLFAISGVSGGSLGAAGYVAAMPRGGCESMAPAADGKRWEMLRAVLVQDFLPPPIGVYLTTDLLVRLSFMDLPDRAAALERAWEQAWKDNWHVAERRSAGHLDGTFLSLWMKAHPEGQAAVWNGRLPLLLLNGTHAPTGLPILTAPVQITQDQFPIALDLLHLVGRDIPLSTAVTNSARFPLVTPGGQLASRTDGRNGSVMDGGYIENFGADTARDLVAAIKAWPKAVQAEHASDRKRPVPAKPTVLVIQISSDPSLPKEAISRCGSPPARHLEPENVDTGPQALSDAIGPLLTVTEARGARGARSAGDLARQNCPELNSGDDKPAGYAHFALCDSDVPGRGRQAEVVGLNWALTDVAAEFLAPSPGDTDPTPPRAEAMDFCGNREQLKLVVDWFRKTARPPPPAAVVSVATPAGQSRPGGRS